VKAGRSGLPSDDEVGPTIERLDRMTSSGASDVRALRFGARVTVSWDTMATPGLQVVALIALTLCVAGVPATPAPGAPVAQAAQPELVSELGPVVERARQRFEARDAAGVLAHVSEQYRSGGLTKADLRQQLLAMFALYEVAQG
jgi:hypothetical protein